jgi:hypothetical protein
MSTLSIVAAPLLDRTDDDLLTDLGIARGDLTSDAVTITQELAARARNVGLSGLYGPSAADPEDPLAATIVIFPRHLDRVRVANEWVGPFPEDLLE